MRIVLFFDLPTLTKANLKSYRDFVKFLKKSGFYMLQESVYIKLCMDQRATNSTITTVKNNKPTEGNVIIFSLTEKQFNDMVIIIGEQKTDVVHSLERTVIL